MTTSACDPNNITGGFNSRFGKTKLNPLNRSNAIKKIMERYEKSFMKKN